MGKPLMIQEADDLRIRSLKRRLGLDSKIGVVRAGLELLEQAAEREEKVKRWKHASALVAATSREVNKEFQKHSRIKKV